MMMEGYVVTHNLCNFFFLSIRMQVSRKLSLYETISFVTKEACEDGQKLRKEISFIPSFE